MRFRPCIDIHQGKVKQIVGSSLGQTVLENYTAEQDAAWFASFYQKKNLSGGHVILLDPIGSSTYERTQEEALSALAAWPGGLQVGGGVTPENTDVYLAAGASHVIVTSYVFHEGKIDAERLHEMVRAVGKDRLVLDLSCKAVHAHGDHRKRYYIATEHWQTVSDEELTVERLQELSSFCSEFLVHAVDVEGKQTGIEEDLLLLLAQVQMCPITYAGGVRNRQDIEQIRALGQGQIDFTVGSALDLFGGALSLEEILSSCFMREGKQS